jgi:hypothetical protein
VEALGAEAAVGGVLINDFVPVESAAVVDSDFAVETRVDKVVGTEDS